jgi:DNA-directed RNA polymerase specialized sigma24 family protein
MKKPDKISSSKEDDIHLIQKIAQRDPAAFAAFYDHTAKTVFTFLSSLLKNRGESEDTLQETFWQVWRQAASYEQTSGTPAAWVLTIARNLSTDRLKHVAIFRQKDACANETLIEPHLLADVEQVAPPPSVRANLLNAMEQEKSITPRFPFAPPAKRKSFLVRFPWLMATGWVLAGIFGAILFRNINADWEAESRQDAEIASLRLTLAEKEEAILSMQTSLSEKEEALALIEARRTVAVVLMGEPHLPHGRGKIFWNPEKNAGLFFAFDLPLPQEGKVYQLWAIQKEVFVDAGVFSFSMETGSFKIKPIPNSAEAVLFFTVTVEPAGGSSQPTGDVLLKGAVS